MQDDTPQSTHFDPLFVRNMIESFLRIGLLLILLVLSYDIIKPFTVPIVWGAIIAMAAFPLVKWLERRLGGRRGLAASLVSLSFIILLVVPAWSVTNALLDGLQSLSATLKAGSLHVRPPNESVREWPFIGERVYAAWSEASGNLQAFINHYAVEIREISGRVLKSIGSSVLGVLTFVAAILIAGGFMAYADSCGRTAHRFFVRIGGLKPGGEWAPMTVATVRSVLQGVIGIAVIQTALIALGLWFWDVPGTPLWSAIILVLAIAQLPALLVVAPIIIWMFSVSDTATAVAFMVYQIIAGASDNILKPILLGRGLDIPMPVILIGAIGGMIASGIVGLFAGAVVLSIWYKLFGLWIDQQAR
ncbi:MAG: AI-2E family transporter [Halioglobus sp.]|nr:AI-2E family transporter [Halioglobus sp.]